jgi:hypothetical protein
MAASISQRVSSHTSLVLRLVYSLPTGSGQTVAHRRLQLHHILPSIHPRTPSLPRKPPISTHTTHTTPTTHLIRHLRVLVPARALLPLPNHTARPGLTVQAPLPPLRHGLPRTRLVPQVIMTPWTVWPNLSGPSMDRASGTFITWTRSSSVSLSSSNPSIPSWPSGRQTRMTYIYIQSHYTLLYCLIHGF